MRICGGVTLKVGIDVGGTFTDFLLMHGQGRTCVHKELSTPSDPSLAVMRGLAALAALRSLPFERFLRDIEMRRGVREEMHNNRYLPPPPIVPRSLRLPVTERVDASGGLVTPLDAGDVSAALAKFQSENIEAVAICFLHAHANRRNEEAAARLVREALPDAYVSASCEVLPQVRFYERTSTTVLNAGVGSPMAASPCRRAFRASRR